MSIQDTDFSNLAAKPRPNEPGIEENLSVTEGLVSQIEENLGMICDKLSPVRNTKPSPAPSNTGQDTPLQSPLFMRISTVNNRLRVLIETQSHLMSEIDL